MAENNQLVFYQQGAVAGQQVDKYSTNPGCVDSKNLDIFSDSQCVKAMAWTAPTQITNEWVDIDSKERFYLASDGRVYDSVAQVWYDHSYFDTNANTINYNNGQGYAKAVFGTPKKLFVAYDSEDNWKTISILTDRLIYNIYSDWIHLTRGNVFGIRQGEQCTDSEGSPISGATSTVDNQTGTDTNRNYVQYSNSDHQRYFSPGGFHSAPNKSNICMRMKARYRCRGSIFSSISVESWSTKLYWNNVTKAFEDYGVDVKTLDISGDTINSDATKEYEFYFDNLRGELDYYSSPSGIYFHGTCESPNAWVDVRYYKKEDWTYLIPKNRNIIEIEDDIYVEVDGTEYEQLAYYALEDESGNTYYQLTQVNSLDLPDDTQIVAFARGFDYQYCFANKGDIGIVYYMTDASLATWDVGWRFPGTKFINAILIGSYAYVIAEKRGVRGLYIFSQGDMKPLVGADKRYTEGDSIIDGKEIYNFSGIMANWRDRVVCPTKDTVFMWGRNKIGQNVGAFILKVDGEITEVKTERGYLDVYYTSGLNTYMKTLQDDVNIRTFESDFSVTYPVQIGTHMLEKEVRDLEISYFIPGGVDDQYNYLDIYLNVNDYFYWTFTVPGGIPDITAGDVVALKGGANYDLVFLEKNGDKYTFYLDGGLPYQTSNAKKLIYNSVEYAYTDMDHFKKIGRCAIDNPMMLGGKHRIFKISAENQLPIVRKMQIRVDGHTNTHVTPEIYTIRLLSEQIDK